MFVARQPIFDRSRELYAYELLFRSDELHNECNASDSTSATTQVIANSLFSIGLENLACGKRVFVNFDYDLLMGGLPGVLPKETMVLEILETVEPTKELLAVCADLSEQGYTFALDDYVGDARFEPLTRVVKIIKVDMRTTNRAEQERILKTYRPRGIAMLAEKVETHDEFEWAKRAGYDYFQGYFFARPAVMRGHQIPAAKINCVRLLREMQSSDLNYEQLRKIISEDVSLSYKLLRFVNSALFARQGEIQSIAHSLAILGDDAIRHWSALAALPVLAKDKPGELVTHSLVRARFCERLSQLAQVSEHSRGFLVGLFSLLDALIDVPLEQALQQAGVHTAISGALLGTEGKGGPLRDIYTLVCRYEAGDWKAVSELARKLNIAPSSIGDAYSESTLWAHQVLHATSRKSNSRRKTRHGAQGSMQILWEDSAGREKMLMAQLLNVSMSGLQMQLPERIPIQTAVSCSAPKMGVSGRGVVRYCNPSKGKFLIGLEFTNGTGWREPA